jgi:hypothetical protein
LIFLLLAYHKKSIASSLIIKPSALQVCSDVIADGCDELGKPNTLISNLVGSVMSASAERPFFQAKYSFNHF